jgi:hypothetical protein
LQLEGNYGAEAGDSIGLLLGEMEGTYQFSRPEKGSELVRAATVQSRRASARGDERRDRFAHSRFGI